MMKARYAMAMTEESQVAVNRATTRRNFLKFAVLAGAAASAVGLLARGPLSRKGGRSIPADIPGDGSIFQPLDDGRKQ